MLKNKKRKIPAISPGEQIRTAILDELGMSVTELAYQIGIGRPSVNKTICGHLKVTPNLAIRLERVFPYIYSATQWLEIQNRYDLAIAEDTYDISDLIRWKR